MEKLVIPSWIETLEEEDFVFIKNFILSSGSLKEMANMYGVTYPTVRLRLDRLIQKIKINDNKSEDTFINLIKNLAINDKIDFDTTKLLINEYRKNKKED